MDFYDLIEDYFVINFLMTHENIRNILGCIVNQIELANIDAIYRIYYTAYKIVIDNYKVRTYVTTPN